MLTVRHRPITLEKIDEILSTVDIILDQPLVLKSEIIKLQKRILQIELELEKQMISLQEELESKKKELEVEKSKQTEAVGEKTKLLVDTNQPEKEKKISDEINQNEFKFKVMEEKKSKLIAQKKVIDQCLDNSFEKAAQIHPELKFIETNEKKRQVSKIKEKAEQKSLNLNEWREELGWLALPNDMWNEIGKYLRLSDILKLMQTSKKLKKIFSSAAIDQYYISFSGNTIILNKPFIRKELEIMSGLPLTLDAFRKYTKDQLRKYLAKEIRGPIVLKNKTIEEKFISVYMASEEQAANDKTLKMKKLVLGLSAMIIISLIISGVLALKSGKEIPTFLLPILMPVTLVTILICVYVAFSNDPLCGLSGNIHRFFSGPRVKRSLDKLTNNASESLTPEEQNQSPDRENPNPEEQNQSPRKETV